MVAVAFVFIVPSTQAAPLALLDHRAWELVSPLEKNGGAIQGPGQNSGGDVLQAASQGGAITYSSASSFGEGAQGAPTASQYLSRRTEAGWSTANITAPALSGSYGSEPTGVPYQLFSPDLARGLLLNGVHCRGEGESCPVANPPLPGTEAPAGYQDYYLRDDETGAFAALLTRADADLALPPEDFDIALAGASPDLRYVALSTCAALTPDATEVTSGAGGCEAEDANLYEWSEATLRLINVLPGEADGTPGASLAAQAGAVSADGLRVFFNDAGKLYLREGAATHQLDAAQGGGAAFQTATPDGSLAFFTKAGHLYRYDAATEEATDLTPSGGVAGVLGASESGASVYYQDAAGLWLWREGASIAEVAPGPGVAESSDYPPTTGTARVSSDGSHLAFLSKGSLTGYDNTDRSTGKPDTEVYLYSAAAAAGGGAGTLTCASCNPTGARPLGPSTIPGAIANGTAPGSTDSYKPRDLSGTGRRIFFDSEDSLLPADTDNAPDVYEWEAGAQGSCQKPAGCLDLVSSGRGEDGASFIDASADGADTFFLTGESLVPSDPGSADLYDARENGGIPEAATPIECDGDACQPLPSPPEDPTPGTLVHGPANPSVHFTKPGNKKKHRRHHKKHHRKVDK